jgi:hypothetical protein
MVVTISNLYSESREILKNLINTNITDPRTNRTNSNRKWIYRERPDISSFEFKDFPFIVLSSPDAIENIQDLFGSLSDTELPFSIEVYTKFNDETARLDIISDAIYALFKTKTHIQALANNNLYRPIITSSPFQLLEDKNKQISGRVFEITFQTTMEDNS